MWTIRLVSYMYTIRKAAAALHLTYHVYPGGHVSQADSSFFLSVVSGLPNFPKGQLESHDVWPGTD